jgi:hypothetical protein
MPWYYVEYELEGQLTIYSYHIEAASKQYAQALVEKQEMAQINLSTIWVEAMTDEEHTKYRCPVLRDDAYFSVLIPHKDVLDIDLNSDTLHTGFHIGERKAALLLKNYAYTQWLESLPEDARSKETRMDYVSDVTPTSTGYLVQFYPEGKYR